MRKLIDQARAVFVVVFAVVLVSISLIMVYGGLDEKYTVDSSQLVESKMCNCNKHVAYYIYNVSISNLDKLDGCVYLNNTKVRKPLKSGDTVFYSKIRDKVTRYRFGAFGVFFMMLLLALVMCFGFSLINDDFVETFIVYEIDYLNMGDLYRCEFLTPQDLIMIILGFKLPYHKKRMIVEKIIENRKPSNYNHAFHEGIILTKIRDYYHSYKIKPRMD